jgi:hypothetical protein
LKTVNGRLNRSYVGLFMSFGTSAIIKKSLDMKKRIFVLFSLLLPFFMSFPLSAQQTQSDNENEICANPVVCSDFSEPGIIRMDSTLQCKEQGC